ncbi:MAG: hypothetical protein QJR09_07310 [Micrococcus sp.]|nr:hypothetical protein [Micrococcus sp.]
MSGLPPIPVNATVIDLRAIAAAHEVPIVYVLDEYMRQHPQQDTAAPGRAAR